MTTIKSELKDLVTKEQLTKIAHDLANGLPPEFKTYTQKEALNATEARIKEYWQDYQQPDRSLYANMMQELAPVSKLGIFAHTKEPATHDKRPEVLQDSENKNQPGLKKK